MQRTSIRYTVLVTLLTLYSSYSSVLLSILFITHEQLHIVLLLQNRERANERVKQTFIIMAFNQLNVLVVVNRLLLTPIVLSLYHSVVITIAHCSSIHIIPISLSPSI